MPTNAKEAAEATASDVRRPLSPQNLPRLACDILAARGHREIRIVDGPGDGGRDVHSVDQGGERFITQCTHRSRRGATVTSAKLRDLPDALMKFGAKRGLFITNGRISPSAKREFLDSYQSMKLEFLDGESLEREVVENAAVAAMWHDGRSLCEIANVVRIPVLVRDLQVDAAVTPDDGVLVSTWKAPRGCGVRCEALDTDAMSFPRYRPPTQMSLYDTFGPRVRVCQFEVTGPVELAGLSSLVRSLVGQLLELMSGSSRSFLGALTGRVVLVPRVGRHVNIPIVPTVPQVALMMVDGEVIDEWVWLAEFSDEWLRQERIYNAVADETRRYLKRLDICGSVSLLSRRSAESSFMVRWQEELFMHRWKESIFALWDRVHDESVAAACAKPSLLLRWVDGRSFGAWLRSDFDVGLIDVPWFGELLFPERVAAIERAFQNIRHGLASVGVEDVSPAKARHMIALVDQDPWPSSEVLFRFVDLERSDLWPSPVDVGGRCVSVDVCWRLVDAATLDRESLIAEFRRWWAVLLEKAPEMGDVASGVSLKEGRTGLYVVAQFTIGRLRGDAARKSVESVMRSFVEWLSPALEHVEAEWARCGRSAERATAEYWQEAYGIVFCGEGAEMEG